VLETLVAESSAANRAAGDVLIVRHGPGRGRDLLILPQIDEHIAKTRPTLRPRIRVHATGSPPPSLDGVVAALFLLCDPLRENYPDCFVEAVAIADAARERGIKLLNPPEHLSNSVKSRQAELWQRAGIPCASARAIRSAANLEPAMAALGLPMILRSDDQHVQVDVRLCKRIKHVDEAKHTLTLPAVALQLIDVRKRWREAAPDSVMARFHHKKRAMVYGDTVLNNHVFFSRSPIVGQSSCTFMADRRRARKILRGVGIGLARWRDTLAADYEFFHSPPEAPDVMLRAVAALGLHIAAIDYASLPGGEVVLWEANPYVHLPPWRHAVLADERHIRERTGHQVEVVTAWLERLAEGRSLV
jgi:glutathione synthase/RimK-type ligase-like ATP-grasp enzyme